MGSIRNRLVRAAAVSALGVTAMAGFTGPASAAQAAATAADTAGPAPAATPVSNIEGSPARWVPTKLTAGVVTGTCSKTNNSFSIGNKTSKPQTVYTSKNSGTLKPGQTLPVCAPAVGTAKVHIKGSTSVLTVTVK